MILTSFWENPAVILVLLLVLFGAIALTVFIIRKVMNKNKVDEKPTETQVVEEDLDRYLETVEDEDTQKAFDNYENNSEEKEDK